MEDATLPPSTLSLKEQKELFVTGHDGTTPWEILLVCSAAPIGILLFQSIRALEEHLMKDKKPNQQATSKAPFSYQQLSSIIMEGAVLWLPLLICQTNLLIPWGFILLAFEAQASVFIFLYFWSTKRWMKIRKWKNADSLDTVGEDVDPDTVDQLIAQEEIKIMKDSMTVYRSSLQYLTFVAILAVDFHIFPRRFAKTEVSGYGLMDLGAGSFVVAAGLVSLRARQGYQDKQQQQQKISLCLKDFIRIAPLLLIGFIRLASNKGLEYQEHVSEYGVHWNFFFTLAMVTPLGSLLPGKPTWVVPLFLLAGYQMMLTKHGGQEFIEDAPRTHCSPALLEFMAGDNPTLSPLCTLFAANREGVLGCIGYLFLYLSSEYIAYAYLWTTNTAGNNQGRLWLIAVALWVLLYFLVEGLGIVVSRRSTNASFCIWTLAHSMLLLAAIHSAMRLYQDPRQRALAGSNTKSTSSETRPVVPIVFQAVNRHGFLSFLVANLLTGLTNLTINTLEVSDPMALLVLFVYLCAVGCFALVLHYAITKTIKGKGDHDVKEKKE